MLPDCNCRFTNWVETGAAFPSVHAMFVRVIGNTPTHPNLIPSHPVELSTGFWQRYSAEVRQLFEPAAPLPNTPRVNIAPNTTAINFSIEFYVVVACAGPYRRRYSATDVKT